MDLLVEVWVYRPAVTEVYELVAQVLPDVSITDGARDLVDVVILGQVLGVLRVRVRLPLPPPR